MRSRNAIAKGLRIDERTLRGWEEVALMPRFGSIPPAVYRDRAAILLLARKHLSLQRVRLALAAGGS